MNRVLAAAFILAAAHANGAGPADSPYSLRQSYWLSLKGAPASTLNLTPEEFRRIQRVVWTNHSVGRSDNIWKLAKSYGTSASSLQSTNSAELIWVTPGSSIMVMNKRGTLHKVKAKPSGEGETLVELVRFYEKDAARQQALKEKIVLANNLPGSYLLTDEELAAGTYLLVPDTYFEFDTFRIPFKNSYWPRISSGFGLRRHPVLGKRKFHEGLDIPQPHGTPVYPSRSGRVIMAGWMGGYGQVVILKHSDGTTSRYGHLSQITVQPGTWAEAKKKMIGKVGSTGLSTGPHLHFEIRDSRGRPINPKKKIR